MSGKRKGISDKVDGKLYSIDKDGKVRFLLDNLQLSNGMEWSIDEKFFYHTDSDTNIIKEYSFNKETGDIAFTGREILVNGVDGFTIGEDGCLYVACWGQGHIAVVDTKTFKVKKYISVPAKIPASCCFAGENMEKFIAVTASYHTEISEDNKAGFTFITNFGIKGRKPYLFG